MTTTERQPIILPPGTTLEFVHRFCPRCGLSLVDEPHQAEDDQAAAEQIEGVANEAWLATTTPNSDDEIAAFLERMVAPLSEAEKERAEGYEKRWLAGQDGQRAGCGEQKDGEPRRHEGFVPMIQRQFFEWVGQFRRLF